MVFPWSNNGIHFTLLLFCESFRSLYSSLTVSLQTISFLHSFEVLPWTYSHLIFSFQHDLILFITILVPLSYKLGLNVTHYLTDNCINYRESNIKNLSPTFSTNSLHYKLLPQFPQSVASGHPSSKHSCKFSPFS